MRSSKSRSRSKANRPRSLGNIINRVFDSSGPEGKVRGTPQQIIDKLNSTLNAIFKEPDFRTKWEAIGTPVVAGTAAAFGELIRRDTVRLGKVVKDSGATVD